MSHETSDRVLNYPFLAPGALEPPPELARLRKESPIAEVRLPSGDTAALLTRYDDVRHLLSNPQFSRNLGQDGAARMGTNEGGTILERREAATLASGESHMRWRRLLAGAFTVKRMYAMQPKIRAMANQLVDEMVKAGAPADLVRAFAFPLPVWVIGELLGISVGDRDKLAHWSNTMLSVSKYTQKEIDQAQAEFTQYFKDHIAAKRDKPGDDLLSELIAATDEREQLTEGELLLTGQGLLVAGHETTSNMIAKMTSMLLADRRRWERLLADRSLVSSAVEESLRFDANSGIGVPRFISEDTVLPSGGTVARGTTVMCSLSAANRDETAFDRADEMDLARSPNAHLAFGAGPTTCLGQALARTELQTALEVLLDRLPTLELGVKPEELPRREGLLVGGIVSVSVRW